MAQGPDEDQRRPCCILAAIKSHVSWGPGKDNWEWIW